MFGDIFYRVINSSGLEPRDIEKLLRKEEFLTDEQIFCVSDFLNRYKSVNIFFTRKLADMTISARLFDIAIIYEIRNKDNRLMASIDIDFVKKTFFVNYENERIEIYNSFVDFEESKKTKLNLARMIALNEICIRYFTKLIYAVYKEIRRNG